MPWCSSCDRFLSPATVHGDGTCPTCGRPVDPGGAKPAVATATSAPAADSGGGTSSSASSGASTTDGTSVTDDEVIDPIPWHFKLLLGAITLYLGYRAFQGIEWIAGLL